MKKKRIARMVAVVSILLIVGTALISSGICIQTKETIQQSFFETQEEKTLTQKDTGILLLSAIFTKDHEVRSFLFKVIHLLREKGELTQGEVQNLADNSFEKGPKIFLFSNVHIADTGIVIAFPGFISSFFTKNPGISIFIYEYGYITINGEYYGLGLANVIGFYGQKYNYRSPRDERIWRHKIDGIGILTLVVPE